MFSGLLKPNAEVVTFGGQDYNDPLISLCADYSNHSILGPLSFQQK